MIQRIFVYGTLKRGGRFSYYLRSQRFVGEARTEPRYRLVDCGGYPGMYPAGVEEEGRSIEGEIWEVDEPCRRELDVLEDVAGGEYELVPVPLLPPFDGEVIHGYLYRRFQPGMPDAGSCWPV